MKLDEFKFLLLCVCVCVLVCAYLNGGREICKCVGAEIVVRFDVSALQVEHAPVAAP